VKAAEMGLDIMSPREKHGGHFAIKFNKSVKPKLTKIMEESNIIVDYRDFNETEFVMRAGFIAMYNDKSDCDSFIHAL
jgi:kynureninase